LDKPLAPFQELEKKKYLATREVPHKRYVSQLIPTARRPHGTKFDLRPPRCSWSDFPGGGVKGSQRVFLSSQECYGALELF